MQLQAQAPLVLAVVCDHDHWASVLLRRGSEVACFVDGKQRETTKRLAEAFLVLAQEQDGCKYVLQETPVSAQADEWSCGHRVLCTLDRLLSSDWPFSVDPATYSRANMLKVIDGVSDDAEDRMILDLGRAPGAAGACEALVLDRPDEESTVVQEPEPKRRRRQLTEKQKEEQDYQAGIKLLADKGITFNETFQKQHHENRLPMGKGHWRKFVVAVHRDTAIKNCLACSSLRDRCHAQGQADENPQPIQEGSRTYNGEGRPRKDDVKVTLQSMLAKDRPGVYEHVRTSWYWCCWCKKEVNFHRLYKGGWKYVNEHESARCHRRPGVPAPALAGKPATCEGIVVGDGVCTKLDCLENAIAIWLQSGLIQCQESDPLSPTYSHSITWQNDRVIVKSRYCKGSGGSPCERCFKQASSNLFINEVVHWTTRIHMVTYVTTLAEGTEQERRDAKEKLMSSDVYHTRAGRREVEKQPLAM